MATNTAASFTNHTGNGTAGPFSISFSYLSEAEVDVTVGGVLKTLTTHYTFTSATQITFTSGNEPGNGVAINIQRDTNITAKKVDFNDGSVLTESDLDTQNDQILFAVQENLRKLDTIEENATGDQTDAEIRTAVGNATDSNVFTDAEKTKLAGISTGATTDQTASDIRTLVESASDSNVFTDADHTKLNAIEDNATADQTNSEIKTAYEANSDTNAFTDAEKTKLSGIATGAEVNVQSDFNATSGDAVILNKPTIPSALNDLSDVNTTGAADGKILKFQSSSNTFIIADDANDGGGGGGGSLTDGDKGDITVSSSGSSWSIDASAVSTNKIADDAVTQAKIADDAVGADQIAASAVVTGSIVDDAVTQAKVADNAIGADQIAANAVGASELADNAVDEAAIADDAVTRDKINAVSTSSLPSFEAKGDGSSQDGYIQLNCSQNSHGVKIKSPPHSANASYTLTLPNNDGDAGQFLKTDGSGVLSFDTVSQPDSDKITEGNTEAEVVDTGSDGHFKVTTEGTERFRVIADGKVGIGTSTPGELLQIYDASGNPTINVRANNQNTASLKLENDDGDWTISSGTSSYPLNFAVGGSNKLTILNDGKVGIGDTTPSTELEVNGTVTATAFAGSGANLTGILGGIVGFKHVRNTSTTSLNTTSFTTIFSISYTPQDGANNNVYVFVSGQFEQDDQDGQKAEFKISCSGQHTTDIVGSEQKVGTDQNQQSNSSICTFLNDTNISNNNAITYNFQAKTTSSQSDFRPKTSLCLTVIEVASGVDQS